jgi:hypothetical protein
MKKILKKILPILIFFLSSPILFNSAWAGFFQFDKTTVTVANGATFQIAVTVDPGSDSLNSTDSYVTYDPSLLQVTAVTAGSLFPTVSHDETTSGKVYIAGMVNDPASSIPTAGTLATITFQALKDGSGTLSFDCNTSKIIKNDINASNVLVCSQNGTAVVTVGSGNSSSSSSSSSNNSSSNSNNTTSQLPQSGVFDNVVKLVIPGTILLILGSVLRFVL